MLVVNLSNGMLYRIDNQTKLIYLHVYKYAMARTYVATYDNFIIFIIFMTCKQAYFLFIILTFVYLLF